MTIEEVLVDGYLQRRLSTAVYMVVSVLGGMAILVFALAMGYQVLQLIHFIL